MTRAFLVPLAALSLLAATACGDLFDGVVGPESPDSIDLSLTIAEPPDDLPRYDRDDWRHWVDDDGDCQDTRQEVLVAESVSRVTYRDDRQCRVDAGQWRDPYTGRTLTDPGDLDVDHLVPLANAHRSGGWAWSAERKRQFANDLGDDAHLIAVTASANRQKGAKGPEEWRPPDMAFWCEYATAWARVKRAWDLTVTVAESIALREMLQTCDGPVSFEATGEVPVARPVTPQPAPLPPGTYATCVEAEAAGEPRVKGGIGEGWGYPASLLPNSRDGDADGVVCEAAPPASAQPTATPSLAATPFPSATSTPPPPTATLTPSPPTVRTYGSCAEAEAAGEPRVKGGMGEGWGYPASLLPDIRDGDGDGVVCEAALPANAQPTATPSPTATSTPPPPTATPTPSPTPTATPTPAAARTYSSCAEADAAGEERVQGSIGGGVGFPAELVPSARDGDGDGVVCEVRSPASPSASPDPTATPTVAPDGRGTYASCDEAEAAGEPRVQGSSGPGRGFPAELVPSARDGDGDGVVCEE